MRKIRKQSGGTLNWKQEEVTYQSFLKEATFEEVFNPQTIIDVNLNENENNMIYFTISEAVIARLLNGQAKRLAILPSGAVHASFYGDDENQLKRPVIYFNTQ